MHLDFLIPIIRVFYIDLKSYSEARPFKVLFAPTLLKFYLIVIYYLNKVTTKTKFDALNVEYVKRGS